MFVAAARRQMAAIDHNEAIFFGLEGLKVGPGCEPEVLAGPGWPPVGMINAVGREEEHHAFGGGGLCLRRRCVEERNRERCLGRVA